MDIVLQNFQGLKPECECGYKLLKKLLTNHLDRSHGLFWIFMLEVAIHLQDNTVNERAVMMSGSGIPTSFYHR